jgi:hypothetical protein
MMALRRRALRRAPWSHAQSHLIAVAVAAAAAVAVETRSTHPGLCLRTVVVVAAAAGVDRAVVSARGQLHQTAAEAAAAHRHLHAEDQARVQLRHPSAQDPCPHHLLAAAVAAVVEVASKRDRHRPVVAAAVEVVVVEMTSRRVLRHRIAARRTRLLRLARDRRLLGAVTAATKR